MDVGLVIGLLAGVVGVGFAVVVMVGIPLGWLNRFFVAQPIAGARVIGKGELLKRILDQNDELQPWGYRLTPSDDRADLVAEWRIADARWWGFFGRSRFSRTYRAYVTLDEEKRELRINEESAEVLWTGSANGAVPHIGAQASYFRGIILFERSREKAFSIKEMFPPDIGMVYDYDFDPWRVKGPLLRLAVENGWSYCPVVLRSQLGRKVMVTA